MENNNALSRLANSLAPTDSKKSASEEFLKGSEVVMLLIDTSGSMDGRIRTADDSVWTATGERKIDALRKVVATIQGVSMIAFGGPYTATVRFVDRVPEPDGGTPLTQAILYAKEYGATRLVVISDGMPDPPQSACFDAAKKFGGQIDVVFIGGANDGGATFLDELARITGGKRIIGDLTDTKQLSGTVIGLLEGEVEEKKAPIAGEGFAIVDAEVDLEEDDDDEDDDDEDDDDEDDDE